MKKIVTIFMVLAFPYMKVSAQNITVASATGQMPATFIQNNLLGGGVYVFNAKYANSLGIIASPGIGTFQSNGYSGLSMQSGIVMTTGDIDIAVGPNSTGSQSTMYNYNYSDPEMESVATDEINGCSTLDFDFVCLSDMVSFQYCFASEEYPEWVCSDYNDVFAFFLTGPDPITGEEVTRNIAIIPGTDTVVPPDGIAVAINSVNPGSPGTNGGNGIGCYYDYVGYYVDNPDNSYGVQYDGMTSKMRASAQIVPCQVYHMHISVCNVGDNSYDSGVFLEGGSFTAPTAAIGLSRPGVTPIHGSCPYDVPLTLNGTGFDQGTVHFSFGGTAEEGVDFLLTDANGTAFGSEGMLIDNSVRHFVLRGLPNADLSQEKTIEVYLATQLCPAFPDLLTYDTMRFTLDHGGDVRVKDTIITCTNACFEVGTELVYGTDVSYRWMPTTGLDDPYSLTTTAMIFEDADYQLVATSGNGCNSDTADVHVVITSGTPDIPVGIGKEEGEGISVWPNPAGEVIHASAMGVQRVEVFTVEGRKVYEQEYNSHNGIIDISTDGFAVGVYGIRISAADGMEWFKIVVNR